MLTIVDVIMFVIAGCATGYFIAYAPCKAASKELKRLAKKVGLQDTRIDLMAVDIKTTALMLMKMNRDSKNKKSPQKPEEETNVDTY